MNRDDESDPQVVAPPPEPAAIADRYGRTRGRHFRGRLFAIGGTIGALLVAGIWVVWAGLDGDAASLQATDTGHTVVDEGAVTVDWNLSAPVGAPVRCALEAMNAEFRVVGWKVVDIPPGDQAIRTFTETVRTTELASTGLISSCWLT